MHGEVITFQQKFTENKNMYFLNKNHLVLPVALTSLIIFIFAFYYWEMLSAGTIRLYDEYYTLDRSNGFLIKNDWFAVYSNNEPNFKKPPLQYWLTAIAISGSDDLEFALRIWSYLFGLGLLIATGMLAYSIAPSKPYIIPTAVLVLASSPMLWGLSISAMLDAGAAFFFTVAVAGFMLAIRQPGWWYLVSITAGLGALQKAPIGFLAVCGILLLIHATRRFHDIDIKAILGNRHFRIAAILLFLLLLSWPVLQISRYGIEVIYFAYIKQMLLRFAPVGDEADTHLRWWLWFIRDGAGLWIPAMLSLFALPVIYRKPESLILPFLFLVFALLMTMATGNLYPRYLLIILPVLAACLAAVLNRIVPAGIFAVFLACILGVFAGDPFRSNYTLKIFESSQEKYQSLFENFSESLSSEEMPVYCSWSRNSSKIFPGAFSYFASNGRPFLELNEPEEIHVSEIQENIASSYRGLCLDDEFEELKSRLESYEIIERSEGYVHWTGINAISLNK